MRDLIDKKRNILFGKMIDNRLLFINLCHFKCFDYVPHKQAVDKYLMTMMVAFFVFFAPSFYLRSMRILNLPFIIDYRSKIIDAVAAQFSFALPLYICTHLVFSFIHDAIKLQKEIDKHTHKKYIQ